MDFDQRGKLASRGRREQRLTSVRVRAPRRSAGRRRPRVPPLRASWYRIDDEVLAQERDVARPRGPPAGGRASRRRTSAPSARRSPRPLPPRTAWHGRRGRSPGAGCPATAIAACTPRSRAGRRAVAQRPHEGVATGRAAVRRPRSAPAARPRGPPRSAAPRRRSWRGDRCGRDHAVASRRAFDTRTRVISTRAASPLSSASAARLTPSPIVATAPAISSEAAGVQEHDVARRAGLAGQDGAGDGGVVGGVAAAQLLPAPPSAGRRRPDAGRTC